MLAHLIAAAVLTTPVPEGDVATPDRRKASVTPGDAGLDAQIRVRWSEPLDPSDLVDFVIAFDSVLDDGETIDSIQIAPAAEGVAVGLIAVGGGHQPALSDDKRSVTFWLAITSGMQSNQAFQGVGVTCGVQATIATSLARTLQRTVYVRVVEQ